jgi:ribonuclease P protein component
LTDNRFLPAHRIRSPGDFRRAYQRRCTASDNLLLVFGHLNGLEHPRLGLSVSRKVGNAVVRARWKRLLREAFRLTRATLPPGIDLIVIPRQGVQPELSSLAVSLPRLAKRLAQKMAK